LITGAEASHGDQTAQLNGLPTPAAQAALLEHLRAALEPIILAEKVSAEFVLQPGLRLRRAYGRCAWIATDQPPIISVRCTADGDRTRWRRVGAIVGTLLHELAHVRYRSHGPRFWALHRRLVDRAVAAGVYDPTDRDPNERGRGDEKLAGSAARPIALAARKARQERAHANRAALQAWQVGAVGRINTGRGALAGARVRVMGLGRTRLLVETADRRRYRVAPALLVLA
jgi:WLM domain